MSIGTVFLRSFFTQYAITWRSFDDPRLEARFLVTLPYNGINADKLSTSARARMTATVCASGPHLI
ncbi:hypothetical protein ACYT89_17950 [Ralstonia solanacearum]|uniref:hypothetical protein n=1 Tax=Ralstonia solanacearum TaxID=305 RepID=UPI0012DAE2D8|nr:hypothetical protein [Ralstonia solanacearum]